MIILSHFRNKIATYVENSKLLLEKLTFLIENDHFWVKLPDLILIFEQKSLFLMYKITIFDKQITISEVLNNHFRSKISSFEE